uniref:Uncharacterized protein n=1 Tax=Panagrolaimus superbus TaxID=310955 RepID=A0A914XVY3_9BILA
MSQLYLESTDKFAKKHYLSFIVGIVPYSKISKYLPGISRYNYDKAVDYALQAPKIKRETFKRERFDILKVNPFVDFISSDIVVTGLPFGTKTLKLSNTKLEIPSTLRLQKHFEIIEMYESYMEERGQSHLVLPRSTMFHLLDLM